jgi:hypothetical protein
MRKIVLQQNPESSGRAHHAPEDVNDPEATCGTQEWEHSIDVSLSADLDGSGPGNNHPDHDNLQM